ncbi:hypothetical protein Vadar_013093 [Vaccinium darrowii]|uniref:Uncharacterized protein n=1 Tax=Vaccinium darrowii TaxID=229202 RepID=A0ACB7X0D1_9ERIC|nr:hypothetical protein Vadar_013093 [Vaccinium darrowii]
MSTAIAWNDTANSSHGTFYSGSVQVFATNFIANNISFMNVAPIARPGDVGAQAVAIRIAGDQAAFWGCGFFGAQDTLHDDRGRHYFKDCYIQGSIDFIFGNGRSLYEGCQITSIANPVPVGSKLINGVVTAHGRFSKDENSGFVFVNCSIGGTGRIWLGRAWRPFSTVVFAYSNMTDIIAPEGWNDFNDPNRDQTVFYGEYMCTGAGANTTLRVPYAQILNDTQASPFLNASFIDGDLWLQPFQNPPLLPKDDLPPSRPLRSSTNTAMVDDLRYRLAETEALLERARAQEAKLSCLLDEMKQFVSVMEILETYLKRRLLQQHKIVV